MTTSHIAFIGGGNMAASIIGGLIADGYAADCIHVAEPDADKRAALASRYGIHTETDNSAAVAKAQAVVLATKPQALHEICSAMAEAVQQQQPLIISIAAGIRSSDIDRWLGGNTAIVRSMPNTPAMVQSGATGLYANAQVSASQHELAESIMRAVGITLWLGNEAQLDAVTALSGSGPAYFFYVMEVMASAGKALGLEADAARLLAIQTAFGAAKLALESSEDPAILRERVTSPGGTTERALSVLREGGLEALFIEALQSANDRAAELADQLGAK
ncbi:pyrroline-5-carboxylate reductase [Sulfuriflexus mobilis]|uniref:pyrroline-5-carboxylate reductase n=1 Tax=Sulfuriflexus mobilis TaxID=1811807 RepID=UPI000F81B240|nr:pyrroline-5-carboxylate reductase [Sulfuriflexus mobilis]